MLTGTLRVPDRGESVRVACQIRQNATVGCKRKPNRSTHKSTTCKIQNRFEPSGDSFFHRSKRFSPLLTFLSISSSKPWSSENHHDTKYLKTPCRVIKNNKLINNSFEKKVVIIMVNTFMVLYVTVTFSIQIDISIHFFVFYKIYK